MCEKLLLVACLVAFAEVSSASAVSFITKCKTDDAKCSKASAQAAVPFFTPGIPDLGVEPLDPTHFNKIDASTSDLKLVLSDITITGLRNCEIKKAQRTTDKSKLLVKVLCTLNVDGQYEVGGRILIVPIEGKGKIHVELNKLLINVEGDMGERVDKNGVSHWDIKGWRHTFELKDQAVIELENLFNGNKDLAAAVQSLLRTSANDVLSEVAPPIVKAVLAKVVKVVNHFFHKVPAEELSLD